MISFNGLQTIEGQNNSFSAAIKKKSICFINTNAGLFYDARLRLHVTRNNVEKVTPDVGSISSSPSSKSLFYLVNLSSCNSVNGV